MININELRQSLGAVQPEEVAELLDRLEAAEKERDALRAEVIHIKEVEFPRKAQAVADGWRGKCERLEAKIAEMKRQEPVAWTTKLALEFGASRLVFQVCDVNIWGENGVPLYALPGAQGVQ